MVDFPISTGIRRIADKITSSVEMAIEVPWFTTPITILLSSVDVISTIIIDFSFDTESVIEYTLNDGINWQSFDNEQLIKGGQIRFLDVISGNKINFRAKTEGNLIYCIVSSVP